MAIVIYNDNGTIKVVKLGTYVVSTDANATESYTITWKAYDGTTLKTETKDYGATSTAPIGTTDTVQYDYNWPQNSVVVTGPQTIQEARRLNPQTSAPSIFDSTGPKDIYTMYRVLNNDASSATIYSDVTTTPPTTSRGVVASGAQTASISTGFLKELSGGVIYARAQATGKTMSTIASLYIE